MSSFGTYWGTTMVIKSAKNSLVTRVVAVAAVALFSIAGSAVSAQAATATTALTSEQQSQINALTAKLLDLAKTQPDTASEGAFTGLFVDAASGYDARVIEAAMTQVEGTPGISVAAKKAAANLRRSYAQNGSTGATGALGGFGGLPSSGAPGFSGGGGGAGYQSGQ